MEYGERIDFFHSIRGRGKRTPLDDMPVNEFSYDWYQKAYNILRFSKNENGHIPVAEILVYANNFELIGSKREFLKVIRGLDIAENKFFNKDSKKENKDKDNNSE